MLWDLCQVLGDIYVDLVDFDGGIVGILWRWGWQKCGPYVMLAKITRLWKVYNVFKGLKGSYRHIRHLLFHRTNRFFHTFIILFHRHVENTISFFNTFINVFYCFLALFGYKNNKKERVTTPSLYNPTTKWVRNYLHFTESLSLLNRGKLLPLYMSDSCQVNDSNNLKFSYIIVEMFFPFLIQWVGLFDEILTDQISDLLLYLFEDDFDHWILLKFSH